MLLHNINAPQKYTLNLDTANQTLQNIFEACEQTPNDVPLQILASQKDAIVRPISVMVWVCHIVLFLVLLLPFLLNQTKYQFTSYTSFDSFYVKENYAEEKNIYIRLNSNDIDFTKCYLIDSQGTEIAASDFNTSTNTITFPYDDSNVDIYVSDQQNQVLHLLLTSE